MIALCILALFNNLEDKGRGEIEYKMPVIQKQKVSLFGISAVGARCSVQHLTLRKTESRLTGNQGKGGGGLLIVGAFGK